MISYLNFRSGALSALTLLKKQPLFKSKQDQEEWILIQRLKGRGESRGRGKK